VWLAGEKCRPRGGGERMQLDGCCSCCGGRLSHRPVLARRQVRHGGVVQRRAREGGVLGVGESRRGTAPSPISHPSDDGQWRGTSTAAAGRESVSVQTASFAGQARRLRCAVRLDAVQRERSCAADCGLRRGASLPLSQTRPQPPSPAPSPARWQPRRGPATCAATPARPAQPWPRHQRWRPAEAAGRKERKKDVKTED
jgi:hypothetical protein